MLPQLYQAMNLTDSSDEVWLNVVQMQLVRSNEEDELSEETITRQLRTRTNVSSAPIINPGETASADQESESCIICQVYLETECREGEV